MIPLKIRPMFNYTVEALSDAMPENMYAFCGVPFTMFCQGPEDKEINSFADTIINALKGRVLVNVGDILPPNGNINQVISLGNYINSFYG